ncbi:MAG: hypothetical protein LBD58_11455 [Treponema sp.]|nr:hypothetical protein [Treponema sp.]
MKVAYKNSINHPYKTRVSEAALYTRFVVGGGKFHQKPLRFIIPPPPPVLF